MDFLEGICNRNGRDGRSQAFGGLLGVPGGRRLWVWASLKRFLGTLYLAM